MTKQISHKKISQHLSFSFFGIFIKKSQIKAAAAATIDYDIRQTNLLHQLQIYTLYTYTLYIYNFIFNAKIGYDLLHKNDHLLTLFASNHSSILVLSHLLNIAHHYLKH